MDPQAPSSSADAEPQEMDEPLGAGGGCCDLLFGGALPETQWAAACHCCVRPSGASSGPHVAPFLAHPWLVRESQVHKG